MCLNEGAGMENSDLQNVFFLFSVTTKCFCVPVEYQVICVRSTFFLKFAVWNSIIRRLAAYSQGHTVWWLYY